MINFFSRVRAVRVLLLCVFLGSIPPRPDTATADSVAPVERAPAVARSDDAGRSLLGNYRPALSAFPRTGVRRPIAASTWRWAGLLAALLASVAWHGVRTGQLHTPAMSRPTLARWEWGPLLALTAIAAAVFLVPTYWRYTRYGIQSYDIGIYTHAFWNALNGNGLFNSVEGLDHLSCHASPGLYLLVPAYALHPDGLTLLALNTLALVSGAVPAYLIARQHLGAAASWCAAAVYLVNPALRSLNYDVHEVTFAVPLLLWAMYFLRSQRTRPLLAFLVLAMAFKEDVGTLVCGCGLYIAVFQRRVHLGLVVLLMGLAWAVIGAGMIVPLFGGDHASGYLDRYRHLGDSWVAIALSPLLRPGALLAVLTSADTVAYLIAIFAPFGFLPLLAPAELLLALPALLVNVLSQDAVMRSGLYHYEALLLPGVYVAFAVGVARLFRPWRGTAVRGSSRRRWPGALQLLVVAAIAIANLGPTQSFGRPLLLDVAGDPARDELDTIVALVPPDVPAVSPQHVQPHLSNRMVSGYLNNIDDFSGAHPPFHYAVIPRDAQAPPAQYELVWKGEAYALYRLRH